MINSTESLKSAQEALAREKFEAHFRDLHWSMRRAEGFPRNYAAADTQAAWVGWQAALSTTRSDREDAERLPVPDTADAYLVTYERDGQEWVQAHASYAPAAEEAKFYAGKVTDLYTLESIRAAIDTARNNPGEAG